ncbi:MAG: YqgE/AlgH family protein [Bacteroidia bacterium]
MQGQFLIAHPMLNDGYFKRAVIYLTEDGSEGSLGFVMNFKTDLFLRDLFPHLKNGNFPVYQGGPVSKNQLYYIHRLGHNLSESTSIGNDLFWGGNFFELCHLIEHGKVKNHDIRFFMGYSGWTVNQLKEELIQKAWFAVPAEATDILRSDPKTLWGDELGKIKSSYKVFSDIGFDPNLN